MTRHVWRSVRATTREKAAALPGDELIPQACGTLTHAVTIRRPPREVWPWIAQMGAGSRAGWYSYDMLDNGRRPSARRIIADLQRLEVGMIFPATPGATDAFALLSFESGRSLVLGWKAPDGKPLTTWAFALETDGTDGTRLVVRARAAAGYRFYGLSPRLTILAISLVHFIMQRRQLLGIAERVEAHARDAAAARMAAQHAEAT
jgi:uncharacterized protein YndB with AHSA1/START domain